MHPGSGLGPGEPATLHPGARWDTEAWDLPGPGAPASERRACRSHACKTVDQPGLARIGYQYLVAQAFEDPVHPARVSADFDGDLQLLLGVEAAAEVLRGGAQPALLNELATVGVEDAQLTVLVAEVQPYRHLRLLGATIIHGSILLSGPLTSPYLFADPLTGYCARIGPSHLIYSDTYSGLRDT